MSPAKILVAQGGGPTAVINQSLVGVALEARRFADLLQPALMAAVAANSFRAHFAATKIIFHEMDDQLWARGAAALMLRDVYSAPWTSTYEETTQ